MNNKIIKGFKTSKRIAFFYTQGSLDTVSCLVSTVKLFAHQGYEIDIFMSNEKKYLPANFFDKRIKVYRLNGYYGKNPIKLLWTLFKWEVILLNRLKKLRYRYLVGIHWPGLMLAIFLGKIYSTPVIYYNLEIYFIRELKKISWKIAKIIESWCSRKCIFVISQDKWRAQLLSKENKIPLNKIICLPNSPIGKASVEKSNLLYQKLGIDLNKKIILTMSSRFLSSMFYKDIIKMTNEWPDDWVLVSHSNSKMLCIKKLLKSNKVIFSTDPVPNEMFEKLVSSVDIGLILYQNEDRPGGGLNETYMGFASGQFNYYLKCGIPTITSNQPTFREIFLKYKCGTTISSGKDINKAIKMIFSKYNNYQAEAIKCYNELLWFEKYFSKLLTKL